MYEAVESSMRRNKARGCDARLNLLGVRSGTAAPSEWSPALRLGSGDATSVAVQPSRACAMSRRRAAISGGRLQLMAKLPAALGATQSRSNGQREDDGHDRDHQCRQGKALSRAGDALYSSSLLFAIHHPSSEIVRRRPESPLLRIWMQGGAPRRRSIGPGADSRRLAHGRGDLKRRRDLNCSRAVCLPREVVGKIQGVS